MTTLRQNALKILTCAVACGLVGAADFLVLRYQISISPVYFLLVGYMTWQFRSAWGGVVGALAATVCRSGADYLYGLEYTVGWLTFYQNALMRFVVYLAVVYAMLTYRRTLEVHRQRIEAMRRMLPVCHGCGSLRGPDGRWHTFDKLSQSPFPVVTECPTCATKTPPSA
jgi:hypothetical protein